MKTVFLQVEYKKDLENTKGHSINFCDTPQFQNAAKVAQFTSDVSDLFDIIRRVCTHADLSSSFYVFIRSNTKRSTPAA